MLKTIPQIVSEIRPQFHCLTIHEALDELKSNHGIVVDVREAAEVDDAPVPQSIHISRGTLEMKLPTLYPDINQQIYLHCATGGRATLCAEQLHRLGYVNVSIITSSLQDILDSHT